MIALENLTLLLLARANDKPDCTKETCSIEESLYGYYPSKVVTVILIALFVISLLWHLVQGVKARAWTFVTGLAIGTFLEAIGYVGRMMLRSDPFSKGAIAIQLICLTVAPAFISAGIYLTLKHLIIVYGVGFSRIQPKWYTRIFIFCDVLSIVIQVLGAAMASGSGSKAKNGNNIMILGLVLQVVTLAIFAGMCFDVWKRIKNGSAEFNRSTEEIRSSRRFKNVIIALIIAYTAIMIRCVYRIAEMAGGWQNVIMQDQISFIILDGAMCVIAVFALNIYHPGFIFKESQAVTRAEMNSPIHMRAIPKSEGSASDHLV